ncbi:MAG: transcription antitermination factor NusB, partial [Patescibacteria group bacterium]
MANRHLSRSIAMQSLYEWDFRGQDNSILPDLIAQNTKEFGPGMEDDTFVKNLVNGVISHMQKINQIIEKA